jgi:hypothetical protein
VKRREVIKIAVTNSEDLAVEILCDIFSKEYIIIFTHLYFYGPNTTAEMAVFKLSHFA